MTAPKSSRLLRAHYADLGSVRACRAMIDVLDGLRRVEGRFAPLDDAYNERDSGAYRDTVEHEIARLREQEADYVDDLLAIEADGGPMCPRDYRAPRGAQDGATS